MFICSTLHILLRFIHSEFFALPLSLAMRRRWHLQVHTYSQCIFRNEAMRWEREKTNGERVCDCKHRANNVLYLLGCVCRLCRPLALHHTLYVCIINTVEPSRRQTKGYRKSLTKSKKWEHCREKHTERPGMTLLATVLCWLFIWCVNFFFQKKFPSQMLSTIHRMVHGLSISGLFFYLPSFLSRLFVLSMCIFYGTHKR